MATHAPGFETHVLERLALLERRIRRLKVALVLLLILAMGAALASAVVARLPMGATPIAKTVEAQEFILHDENGEARAWLGMGQDGALLIFHNADTSIRLMLSGKESGAGLGIMNEKGRGPIVTLIASESGPAFGLASEGGGVALRMIEKKPFFGLIDEDGKPIFSKP